MLKKQIRRQIGKKIIFICFSSSFGASYIGKQQSLIIEKSLPPPLILGRRVLCSSYLEKRDLITTASVFLFQN